MSLKTPPNQNPKSKIQNPKSKIPNPKSKIRNPKSKIRNAKSKIQNPKSKIRNPKSKIQNPKSETRNPKSKIQNPKSKIRNPKSKIQNSGNLGRWGPHVKECYITIQNPTSKIPEIRPKKFGFWIGEFWILDSGFWILGGPGDVPLRQFSDGALRSEARIPPGRSLGGNAEPTISDTVGAREGTWWWKQQEKQVKPIFSVFFWILRAGLGCLCPVVRLWRPV